jgi:aspartate aminotransferase
LTASAFSASSVDAAASAATGAAVASSTSKSSSLETIWNDIPQGPPDAILGIAQAFRACEASNKVNVCVGAYRDEQGQPWVLPSVRAAEDILLEQNENKEYLPIEGDPAFIQKAMAFAYGKDSAPLQENRIAGVQSLSGTGACRIGGHFLANFYPNNKHIFVPDRELAVSNVFFSSHRQVITQFALVFDVALHHSQPPGAITTKSFTNADSRSAPIDTMIVPPTDWTYRE